MKQDDQYVDDLKLIRNAAERGQTCVECHGPITLMAIGMDDDGEPWRELRSAVYPKQRLQRVLARIDQLEAALRKIAGPIDMPLDDFPPDCRFSAAIARQALTGVGR